MHIVSVASSASPVDESGRFKTDQHVSVASACVTTAVAEKVAAMKTAEFFAARGGEADIEAARRILRRAGGRPPEPEDRIE